MGDLEQIISILEDRAQNSGFSVEGEAAEIICELIEKYKLTLKDLGYPEKYW